MAIAQDWSAIVEQRLREETLHREFKIWKPLPSDPGSIRSIPLPLTPSYRSPTEDPFWLPPRSVGSSAGIPQGSVGSSPVIRPRSSGSSPETHSLDEFNLPPPEKDSEVYAGMSLFLAQPQNDADPFQDLTYGFGIGRLHHKTPTASRPQDTGFYVICNALDKSIWVAFDFEPYGETGEVESIRPEYGDLYGNLPGDKQNLVIGFQRLFGEDWMAERPLSLDRGDPFKAGAGQPMPNRLRARPAYIDSVVNIIEKYRRKRKTRNNPEKGT